MNDRTRFRESQSALFLSFALVTLVAVILLGALLALSYQGEANRRGLAQGRSEALLMAQTAIGPLLDGRPLAAEMGAAENTDMRHLVSDAVRSRHVLRLRLRDLAGNVVFSNDGTGLHQPANNDNRDELSRAAHGFIIARLTTLNADNHHGPLGPAVVEVYLPLLAGSPAHQVGILEVYLPYSPIRADVTSGIHTLYRNLAVGLGALYLVLFAISYIVGRRLRRQVKLNVYLSEHDALTDLPNRTLFLRRAADALARNRRRGAATALAIIDLDKFKEINDTLGHHNGDLLLQSLSGVLAHQLSDPTALARLGGDEFGVLLAGDDPESVLVRLRAALEHEITIAGLPLSVESSIGYAVSPEDGLDVHELIQCAEIAMYTAKEQHRGVVRYDPSQNRYDAANLVLIADLRQAIDADQLILHYQPQSRLDRGTFDTVEALVRWRHPTLGLIAPDRFIPLAEQTDLIDRLTDWVLGRALFDLAHLGSPESDLTMSVNVSARNLGAEGFARRVVRALDAAGVAPGRLVLEVTETALMTDPLRAAAALRELAVAGVRLSIDDFGVGQTSLGYLSTLPVYERKIDRSFVTDMLDDAGHAAIVRAVIELGHNLGLRVVAEGVETTDVLDDLARSGCDVAQGYLFAHPMPVALLASWLEAHEPLVRR